MGHGRVLVAVVGVLLALPAVAWGDGDITIEGPPNNNAYVYRDAAGHVANLNMLAGGSDTLIGGALADTLNGETGDDTLRPRQGGGVVSGAADRDLVAFDIGPVGASIDGVINDGPSGTLNLLTDVEDLDGSPEGDTLTGSAAANRIRGLARIVHDAAAAPVGGAAELSA